MNEASTAPLISVVVAVRNGARTLEACLRSVFDQTYPGVELIVMDGGSDDGTQAVLHRNDARISYWESKRDRGICHAWNKAVLHTRGDWICFLGADDRLWDKDTFSQAAEALAAAEGAYRIVYGIVQVVGHDGLPIRAEGRPWQEIKQGFLEGMLIPHQATFHHRSLFDRSSGFDERFRIAGDYELLLRELRDHDALFVDGLTVAAMGSGGLSNRPQSAFTVVREMEMARYMHGLTAVPVWRSPRVFRARVRAWVTRHFGAHAAEKLRATYHAFADRTRRSGHDRRSPPS